MYFTGVYAITAMHRISYHIPRRVSTRWSSCAPAGYFRGGLDSRHSVHWTVHILGQVILFLHYLASSTAFIQAKQYIALCPLLPRKSTSISPKPIQRQQAQSRRKRLLASDRAWNRGSSKDKRSKKSKLNSIALSVLDAITADEVAMSCQ